jgi:O-antigen biosynthesis protein
MVRLHHARAPQLGDDLCKASTAVDPGESGDGTRPLVPILPTPPADEQEVTAVASVRPGQTTVVVSSGETLSGLTVSANELLIVQSGATVIDAAVMSGGTVYDYGVTSASQLYGGTQVVESGGVAVGTDSYDGGSQEVIEGGEATGGMTYGASSYVVGDGQFLDDTTLHYGDTLLVQSGGTADDLVFDHVTSATVAGGGTLSGAVISASDVMVYGAANATTVDAGGEFAIYDQAASGNMPASVGSSTDLTVNSGGGASVFGRATGVTIQLGGELFVGSGGYAGDVLDSGVVDVEAHGGTSGVTIGSGGLQEIAFAAEADATIIQNGGRQIVGAEADDVNGQLISSGGYADETTIQSGGEEDVQSGGRAAAVEVQSGGKLILDVGGQALNVQVDAGGYFHSGVAYVVESGAAQDGLRLIAGDEVTVSSGGLATHLIVGSGASATVLGAVDGAEIQGGGVAYAVSATDVTVDSGASLEVLGSAYGTTVMSGGSEDINGGGQSEVDPTLEAGSTVQVNDGSLVAFDTVGAAMAAADISGFGGVEMTGPGVLTLSGDNSFMGGLILTSGTVELAGPNAGGSGEIGFQGAPAPTGGGGGPSDPVLVIDAADTPANGATFANTLSNFGDGDYLDIQGLAYAPGDTEAELLGGGAELAVSNGAETIYFDLSGTTQPAYYAYDDGAGHVEVADAPCYCPGTLILTDRGDVAVEELAIGDRLVTAGSGLKSIRWIGRRTYAARFVRANRRLLPVCVRAGAMGSGLPRRDLWVSPLHAMVVDGCLVPAGALVNGVSVTQPAAPEVISYIHLELEEHNVIYAEGAASESFVDDDSRAMFQNAHTFAELYPAARPAPAVYCLPRVEDGEELERLRAIVDGHAGLKRPPSLAPALRGSLDHVDDGLIEGWAQAEGHPEAPVCLDILVDGVVAATVLANHHRPDLERAGLGSGRHAFSLALDLQPGAEVQVRRSLDGARLPPSERAGDVGKLPRSKSS